ncbi:MULTISPECIES: hypothetical protein [Cyanophyceae]|nr:hypothetical protein [Trichocoleus sp. FACHB-40]
MLIEKCDRRDSFLNCRQKTLVPKTSNQWFEAIERCDRCASFL